MASQLSFCILVNYGVFGWLFQNYGLFLPAEALLLGQSVFQGGEASVTSILLGADGWYLRA